ncbi:hypothetical protein DM02DRAFT_611315 [Periconia macrospinosa]|uniref:Uncharacterized protein n=1 Tax=Periconia macrospinosa TaxID=97972 RepID=A0A2V1E5T9_9PLEO|nr:hypothetical protein DM02DRAFT_611315 [Periconia macrospinosa]
MASNSETDEAAIDAHSRSALTSTKQNLRYLYDPKTAPAQSVQSRRTRAALRLVRSSLVFVFWRMVRYAKYVAIGSLIATIGAGAFGTIVSGAGFVLAPTGIAGTIMAATVWGLGKFVVKRVHRRWEHGHGHAHSYEEVTGRPQTGGLRGEYRGPESVPW